MPRKPGLPTARDLMWEKIKMIYVFGRLDVESGNQEYPSQLDLADEFDVPSSTIGSRATRHKWLEERKEARGAVIKKTREIMEANLKDTEPISDRIIRSLAELNNQDLIILDSAIEVYASKMIAGKIDVSTSEVMKALTLRRKIYHEIYGVSEKPSVEVNVGVAIDFDGLSNKEQETIHNAIARTQLGRGQEGDIVDVTPAGDVPSLDSLSDGDMDTKTSDM